MAYVDDTLLQQDQNQQGQAQADQGGPSISGSAPGATGTSVAPTTTATPAAAPASKTPSNNFADLSNYLKVNEPQQFGQQLAGKISTDISNDQSQAANTDAAFKQRVDADTIKDTSGVTQQVSQDPTKVDPNSFGALRDATYNGPSNFSDASDLYNQAQGATDSASQKASALQTEGGRFGLLDSYFGRPDYSQGQKSLDNLLVQDDPNSQQAFQQIQSNASNLAQQQQARNTDLSAYGNLGAQQTADTRSTARDALGIDDSGNYTGTGAIADAQTDLANRTTAANAAAATQYQNTLNQAASNKFGLSPDFLKAIGVTNPQGYGVDPSKYLTAGQTLSQEQVATPQDVARLQALTNLAGPNATPLLSDYTEAGQSATAPAFNFDTTGYEGAVSQNQAQYQQQGAALDKQITSLQNTINQAKASAAHGGTISQSAYPASYDAQLAALQNQRAALNAEYTGGSAGFNANGARA